MEVWIIPTLSVPLITSRFTCVVRFDRTPTTSGVIMVGNMPGRVVGLTKGITKQITPCVGLPHIPFPSLIFAASGYENRSQPLPNKFRYKQHHAPRDDAPCRRLSSLCEDSDVDFSAFHFFGLEFDSPGRKRCRFRWPLDPMSPAAFIPQDGVVAEVKLNESRINLRRSREHRRRPPQTESGFFRSSSVLDGMQHPC